MTNEPKTLFAIKLTSSKRTKEYFAAFLLVLGLFGVLAAFALAQLAFCKANSPVITITQCLASRMGGK